MKTRTAAGAVIAGAGLALYATAVLLAVKGYIAASLIAGALGSVALVTGADLIRGD